MILIHTKNIMFRRLLHFMILLLVLTVSFSLSDTQGIAKLGCEGRCGDISIPYPFGVGPNCSYPDRWFNLICNTSTTTPKLFYYGREIIEINKTYVRVTFPYLQVFACYNNTVNDTVKKPIHAVYASRNMADTPYSFSGENWLTAIGCDDIVVGFGNISKTSYQSSCIAYCSKQDNSSTSGFCPRGSDIYSADGCCRTPLPRGTTGLAVQLSDASGKWLRSKTYSCSYAFIEEMNPSRDLTRHPFSLLNDPSAFNSSKWPEAIPVPVVRLDWRIKDENCSQAQQNTTTYACQGNTTCVDYVINIGGYNCECNKGYEGNPYLAPGCHDIDECSDGSNSCHPSATCSNSPGSYNCTCWNKYFGDGWKNSTGCIKLPRSRSNIINVGIGFGIGLGVLLLLLVCFWLYRSLHKRKKQRRRKNLFKQNAGLLQLQTNEDTLKKIKYYPAKELEKATDHFNESRMLGQGGQGIVYKGMMSDGKIVAIKKSNEADHLMEFINEIAILTPIYHKNVVTLLGCCLETEVPLLVYEFVPNGTLYNLIHDPNSEFPFSWSMRLRIAADVADALSYLHSSSALPIFHRDIKSSNILLGEKYVVKVSDFGTSKTFQVDQTHQTTNVIGTFGYLDPEYLQSSQFTEKSDVYSFGVLLVELLTGKSPRTVVATFLASMETNNLGSILDVQVLDINEREVITVARLAQRCLNSFGKMRPTMKEISTELASLRMSQMASSGEEERVYGLCKAITVSDNDNTWMTASNSIASSSLSDVHPLMIGWTN